MSVQIKLYHVCKAASIEEIKNLEAEIEASKESCLNLYKVYEDLGVILTNNVEPFGKENQIVCKLILGNRVKNVNVGCRHCGGFIPHDEIREINDWIIEQKLNDQQSFFERYNNLSGEVYFWLKGMGTGTKENFYKGYIQPLVKFYQDAADNENSVIICSE